MHKTLFLFLITFCLTWQSFSQDLATNKYANRPEHFTIEQMATFRAELLLFLSNLPHWKERSNLAQNITFKDSDIQIYGYKNYPILQIDFRYNFPSPRKKGYNYEAQYIYTHKIKFHKANVTIDPGTTKYIKT